jgi:hypothetical protein
VVLLPERRLIDEGQVLSAGSTTTFLESRDLFFTAWPLPTNEA